MKHWPFILSVLFVSCSPKKVEDKKILPSLSQLDEMYKANGAPPFSIINKSDFKVLEIFNGEGVEYDMGMGENYFFLGDAAITYYPQKRSFHFNRWRFILKQDTVKLMHEKSPPAANKRIFPKATIGTRGNKYQGIGGSFNSKIFGNITLSSNGLSCDDSQSGQVTLINNQQSLIIKGLANVDVFEDIDRKELYIFSYHNCSNPGLRIFRVSN